VCGYRKLRHRMSASTRFACQSSMGQLERQTMTNIQCLKVVVSSMCLLRIHTAFRHSTCLKPYPPIVRWVADQARRRRFDPSPLISQLCIVDDRRDHPTTTSNQSLQGESNFGDSSGPLFSIYSKAAEDEDNKMVERWQKDADGILIFVSTRVCIRL
jgi:hypothetical protein